jgi:hypothetical protein
MSTFKPGLSAVLVMFLLSPVSYAAEKTITAPEQKFSDWVKLDNDGRAMDPVLRVEPKGGGAAVNIWVEVEYTYTNGETATKEGVLIGGPTISLSSCKKGPVKVRVKASEKVEIKIRLDPS